MILLVLRTTGSKQCKDRRHNLDRIEASFQGLNITRDATANYKVDILNLYENVYQASGTPISFTVTTFTTPSAQSVPAIDTGAGEDSTKTLSVTAGLDEM